MPHDRQNFWSIAVSVAQFGQYMWFVLLEAALSRSDFLLA